jgi:hypothetical protein
MTLLTRSRTALGAFLQAGFLIAPVMLWGSAAQAGSPRTPMGLCMDGKLANQFYRDVRVTPGNVPRGSKGFALWRNQSLQPDTAYNFRYYTLDQVAEAGGWAKTTVVQVGSKKVTLSPKLGRNARARLFQYYSSENARILEFKFDIPNHIRKQDGATPTERAVERFGSVERMFQSLSMDLRWTRAKLERVRKIMSQELPPEQVKFLIDAQGNAYVIFWDEEEKLLKATGMYYSHSKLANLLFPHNAEMKVDLVGAGTLYLDPSPQNGAGLSVSEYTPGGFDVVKYVLNYFGD